MRSVNRRTKLFFVTVISMIGVCAVPSIVFATEETAPENAFPDRFMVRIGAYFVDDTDTQFRINSTGPAGIGTLIDFKKDLGGEERDIIPRIDAYYRFNDRHRIDFTTFRISRAASRVLTGELVIGDETFLIDERLDSDIKYTLYKLGYSYSFYHSPKVELSLSAGLNITSYDLKFVDGTGKKSEAAGLTVPLPVFGLRMGYAITPKWSVQYLVEAFALELDDEFKGSLTNFELTTEYRLFKNFALGAGIASLTLDVEVFDDDWRGQATDRYAGFTAFGTLYF